MCCCGCGGETNLAPRNSTAKGQVRGESYRYIAGHQTRITWATLPKIFWDRVNQNDANECWPYAGVIMGNGYGQVYVDGEQLLAHRVAYILACGEIPEGLVVRHLCNNKVCCNPAHLALGTQQDNADDMTRAERQARGENVGSAILGREQVLEIYARCLRKNESHASIAADYGVDRSAIGSIAVGKSWAWLTGAGGGRE